MHWDPAWYLPYEQYRITLIPLMKKLLTQDGVPIAADLGNPWKAICHTGRAMLECRRRLTRLLGQ